MFLWSVIVFIVGISFLTHQVSGQHLLSENLVIIANNFFWGGFIVVFITILNFHLALAIFTILGLRNSKRYLELLYNPELDNRHYVGDFFEYTLTGGIKETVEILEINPTLNKVKVKLANGQDAIWDLEKLYYYKLVDHSNSKQYS